MFTNDFPIRMGPEMAAWLKDERQAGDVTPELLNLTGLALRVYGHAFCFDEGKESFLRSLRRIADGSMELKEDPDVFFEKAKDKVPSMQLSHLECCLLVAKCFRDGASSEALMQYVETAWDSGINNQRVMRGERGGSIMGPRDMARHFASFVCVFGKRRGLLIEKPVEPEEQPEHAGVSS